jgi:hypothetical protein
VKPGVSPENFEELRAQSQRCLIDLLDAETQLGFTFVKAAAYERNLGQTGHSQHTGEEARKAIAGRCTELDQAVAAL